MHFCIAGLCTLSLKSSEKKDENKGVVMRIQTDKTTKSRDGNLYWAIATICFATASTAAFGALTQSEVDHVVDAEILMCEHEEDANAIEKSLRERGATDEMLAHGYYCVVAKTQNAKKGSLDSEKFHSAVFGFANVASGSMLTNLLTVAKSSTNVLDVTDAILAYHGREPGSGPLLRWCIGEASQTDCPRHLRATIWGCLAKSMRMSELPRDIRDDVLRFSRKGVLGDPMSAFEADRILCAHDPQYAKSMLRKQASSRILSLDDGMVPAEVKGYFEALAKEADK